MNKRIISGCFSFLGIAILILDSRTAISGAQDAIRLCAHSIIPSIFPFLVLSGMLTSVTMGTNLCFLRPIGRLLKIPAGTEGIFITGLLGGYPTGALAVYQSWERGQINKQDANRMLAFCSNAGPSFLFGILAGQFSTWWIAWPLWAIHILSALLVGMITPGGNTNCQHVSHNRLITITDALKHAVKTMGYICGWVIIYRVILTFLDNWVLWLLPSAFRVSIYGILELANGCCALHMVGCEGLRFVLCSALLAFGGICVVMQTASVIGTLELKPYIKGKLMQALFSIGLSILAQYFLFPSEQQLDIPFSILLYIPIIILPAVLICAKIKIRGRNPEVVGV